MTFRKKNIFVVGLKPFNLRLLKAVRHAEDYAFHQLLSREEVAMAKRFDLEALLAVLRQDSSSVDSAFFENEKCDIRMFVF